MKYCIICSPLSKYIMTRPDPVGLEVGWVVGEVWLYWLSISSWRLDRTGQLCSLHSATAGESAHCQHWLSSHTIHHKHSIMAQLDTVSAREQVTQIFSSQFCCDFFISFCKFWQNQNNFPKIKVKRDALPTISWSVNLFDIKKKEPSEILPHSISPWLLRRRRLICQETI